MMGSRITRRPPGGAAALVLLMMAPAAATAQEGRLTLGAAVERALGQHPSVGAARAAGDEARAGVGEAGAARFPALKLAASATQYEEPMVVTPIHGFTPGRIPPFNETVVQTNLTLSYTVFDGGARGARIRQARSRSSSAAASLSASEQLLVSRVIATYLGALSAREVLEAHDRRLAALEAERARVVELRAAGRAAAVEVLRVEAVLASARADRVELAAAGDTAERDLARLVGAAAAETRADRLAPVALADSAITTREALTAAALAHGARVEEARWRRAAAEANLAAARGARWPQLEAVAAAQDFRDGEGDHAAEWNAGLRLTHVLFTGGATRQRIAGAQAASRRAGEELELTCLQASEEVDRALAQVEEARARVESLAEAAARFAEVARIEKLRLETGPGTQTDYLKAEADLLASRASLVEAEHREITARVELARVTGELGPDWITRTLEAKP